MNADSSHLTEPEWTKHHPWCNYFSSPREGCTMCDRFYARFPLEEGMTFDQLLIKHFPDVAEMNGIGVAAQALPPNEQEP